MEQVKKLEPKFKVGDIVYYYNYGSGEIKKDKIVKIEYGCDFYLKNKFYPFILIPYTEDQLFKTFEECKADRISCYERLSEDPDIGEIAKERLEKLKGQVEAL